VSASVNSAAEILRSEIRRAGVIPFRRFMEVALYCPELGYYEQVCHTPGRRGDYFTAVSVGSVLGQCLAWRFCAWAAGAGWERWQLVEAGAHDGRLAGDILGWIRRHRPAELDRLRYWIIEPSARRRRWQQERLEGWEGTVHWVSGLDDLRENGVCGVIFANELLDAMPVSRVGWDRVAGEWFEWGVNEVDGRWVWERILGAMGPEVWRVAGAWLARVAAVMGDHLPEGFTLEVSPAAVDWWAEASAALRAGWLCTLDYGLEDARWLGAGHAGGTLRAYAGHRRVEDVLCRPGERDVTAHVHWTLVREAGERAGLRTVGLWSQGRWLTRMLVERMRTESGWAGWSDGERREFQTLTHPGQMGEQFQVLVQCR
jgi:SAM-dependent MidA family methyltransferase